MYLIHHSKFSTCSSNGALLCSHIKAMRNSFILYVLYHQTFQNDTVSVHDSQVSSVSLFSDLLLVCDCIT